MKLTNPNDFKGLSVAYGVSDNKVTPYPIENVGEKHVDLTNREPYLDMAEVEKLPEDDIPAMLKGVFSEDSESFWQTRDVTWKITPSENGFDGVTFYSTEEEALDLVKELSRINELRLYLGNIMAGRGILIPHVAVVYAMTLEELEEIVAIFKKAEKRIGVNNETDES